MSPCAANEIEYKKKCVTLPEYYSREDEFFGSKESRLAFIMRTESAMLQILGSHMKTGDYTSMSLDLQTVLREHVLKEEPFCFSAYHHDAMLLSALSHRLNRAAREHLFISLQGKDGLGRLSASRGRSNNDIVTDSLFRIDVVQTDFSESQSFRIFSRLKKVFPVLLKYTPSFDTLAPSFDEIIRPPKGITYEGCHFGVQSRTTTSFDSQSHFYNDDGTVRPIAVDDDVWVRYQSKSTRLNGKRNYIVSLNIGLRLNKGSRKLNFHVPVRMLSFSALDASRGSWIHPRLVRIPRFGGQLYSATMYTLFVYYLYSFNSSQLLLAGTAGALHMLEHISLEELDRSLIEKNERTLRPIYSSLNLASLTSRQRALVLRGMRKTADALMASAVMDSRPVMRINFISPETIEG